MSRSLILTTGCESYGMTKLFVTTRAAAGHMLDVASGPTVMEAIRDAGIARRWSGWHGRYPSAERPNRKTSPER